MGHRENPDQPRERLPELFSSKQWTSLTGELALTPRQRGVARLICLGFTNEEMAWELSITVHTVSLHKRLLYRKLNIHDRVGVPVRLILAERRMQRGRSEESDRFAEPT